jgi:DNA-binding NarL/FixJ family response regulator
MVCTVCFTYKQQATSNKQQATSNKQQATSNKQQSQPSESRFPVKALFCSTFLPAHQKHLLCLIAVADDHEMFRELVSSHINTIENCKVVIQAANGRELLEKMETKPNTDLVLLDISMPLMNGYDAAKTLKERYPEIKILFCSMYNSELAICRMISIGGNGCIHKGASTAELRKAFFEVMKSGQYFPMVSGKSAHVNYDKQPVSSRLKLDFSQKELKFMQLICTEETYKQIADNMNLNERQIDYLREGLFARFDVHCRIGLALKVYKSGILTEEAA